MKPATCVCVCCPDLCAAPEPADSNELQDAALHILQAVVVLVKDLQGGIVVVQDRQGGVRSAGSPLHTSSAHLLLRGVFSLLPGPHGLSSSLYCEKALAACTVSRPSMHIGPK